MKKTAIALLLALLMAAALLTSGALASDDEAGPVAKVGNVEYDNFNDAMEAVIESKTTSWLDLLRDVTVDDAQYVIDSSVQIDANGYTLTLNAPEDEDACIFTISKGCFLEISSAELVINGNGKGTVFKAYGPAYTDTRSAVLLTAPDVYISNFENVFDFEKTDNPKSVSVYGGSLNITNISGIGSSGIVTGGLNVAEYSSLTVSGCGSELPIASAEAPDGVSYKYPVEIRAGGNVTIGYDSKLVLEGNNINSVYLVSGSFSNESEVNTDVVTEDEYFWKVEIEGLPTQLVLKEEPYLTMPEAPSKSGYIFLGWSYNGSTYAPGDVVPIDGPMTVKAVWGSLPSVSSWAKAAMIWAMENGLIEGDETGAVNPGATATRAQAAALLARYLTA